ncbi:DUF1015 family protein [Natronosporangium hydrolyticum]|uniref:DUF1015 family protein n=1 Tax=Natronosporangium hydrolyticum TaxID=2811111 RepID=A0A895YPG5_9ACTN|nr:DUF1015 family protein [Natronosporangium hydrolyticum]QSB16000.1 DUF1015 family protein [Natronosporangium hydrolyticum]
MAVVHPIDQAWLSTGGTGAPNYDEFADDAEITSIIAANPRSALAVEMPHRAPESLGTSFRDSLATAASRLAQAQSAGAYTPAERVLVLYRISGPGSESAYGMFAMVDTDQISTSADEPGLVIRNEDVFEEKVRERVALAEATGHLLSPVLLLQSARGAQLQEALAQACEVAGEPTAVDQDAAGRRHEIWPLAAGPTAEMLCDLASGGELVVADGNHRSLAAQSGGLPRFLAVITTPESVAIQPYNRLVTELPYPLAQLSDRMTEAGARVRPLTSPPIASPPQGSVHLYVGGEFLEVELPADPAAAPVDNLDHARVERTLVRTAFELDPADKRLVYVGGDYPTSWLVDEVDAGRAQLAVVIAPVTVTDFVAVNLARQKMPRKSTWFTPKARAGLVLTALR